MQIDTSGPRGKSMNRSALAVRGLNSWCHAVLTALWSLEAEDRFGGISLLTPLGRVVFQVHFSRSMQSIQLATRHTFGTIKD